MFLSASHPPAGDDCVLRFVQGPVGVSTQAIGKILTVTGSVTITRLGGVVVACKVGDPLWQGDVIETAADGAVGMIFKDGTAFNLSASSRMALDEFICGPDGASNRPGLASPKGSSLSLPARSRSPVA